MNDDDVLSDLRATLANAVLAAVGLFGVALVWLAARAVVGGSAARATPVAGLFGVAAVAFAGWELARR